MVSRVNKIGSADHAPGFVSTTQAADWPDALITGNGTLGALCFGEAAHLRLGLSHERLFLPLTTPLDAPETRQILPELRKLLDCGEYQAAAQRVVDFATEQDPGFADTRWIDPFIGAATLGFDASPSSQHPDPVKSPRTGPQRKLDFSTGQVTLEGPGAQQTGWLRHRIFSSRQDQVIGLRTSSQTGLISAAVSLGPIPGTPPSRIEFTCAAHPNPPELSQDLVGARLRLTALFPERWPGAICGYTVTALICAPGGQITEEPADAHRAVLRITDAEVVTALIRVEILDEVGRPVPWPVRTEPLAQLIERHAEVQQIAAAANKARFDQVRLFLRESPEPAPGPEEQHRPVNSEHLLADPGDPRLVSTLFDAGRYAIISSSGQLPPNLQGVWSGSYDPAWCSGYTLDGNLATALSAAIPTRTPEQLLPLFDLMDSLLPDFRANARRLYGARGILTPAHCSTHGKQNHFGPIWCLTFWTAGAGWISRFYYDYWKATGDLAFLAERAWPFMTEVADFYTDFLLKQQKSTPGSYHFNPSYSPENHPTNTGAQACVDATMDVAVAKDLLRNLLECQRALKIDDPRSETWSEILSGLPPYRIGAHGELAEWLHPDLVDHHGHRHASHLYPVWYGDPELLNDPELRHAAERTVAYRLAWWEGGDSVPGNPAPDETGEMAFGLVGLGLAAARLGMRDEAERVLHLLGSRYWKPNLVSTHNAGHIFNVDLCGGYVALVAAMLVRTTSGSIDLLPTLPSRWTSGTVRGLAGCDRVEITELKWTPTELEVEMVSPVDQRINLGLGHLHSCVDLHAGRPIRVISARSS